MSAPHCRHRAISRCEQCRAIARDVLLFRRAVVVRASHIHPRFRARMGVQLKKRSAARIRPRCDAPDPYTEGLV